MDRYFKTKDDSFPFIANHDRPEADEIDEKEYNDIVSARIVIFEQAKADLELQQKPIRDREVKIQAKMRQLAEEAIAKEEEVKP